MTSLSKRRRVMGTLNSCDVTEQEAARDADVEVVTGNTRVETVSSMAHYLAGSVCALLMVLCAVTSEANNVPPYTEDCRTGLYPPSGPTFAGTVSWVDVDLDLPPRERWTELVKSKKTELVLLVDLVKKLASSLLPEGQLIRFVDKELPILGKTFPPPFPEELESVAQASGIPIGEIVLYNLFYEVFTVCTSIVAQDQKGHIFHARNLDFGLFLGWDRTNNTWAMTERLSDLVVNVNAQRGGKTVFRSTTFVGYLGILTGEHPGLFTLTMNERFNLDGGYLGILEWLLGHRTGHWMSFLTRAVLENATSYDEAKTILSTTELLAPAYYILGGYKPGQGCVITRARTSCLDVWTLNVTRGRWFVLETNYDRWRPPFFWDDRRTSATECLERTGAANVSVKTIYDVLSTKPVLNKLTVYTSLMSLQSDTYEAYRRVCPDPCMPW
uniref:acid ceramidase n=1 Tax=Myxine glutinosa TaxID=7769 RepID=UPI00358FA6E7